MKNIILNYLCDIEGYHQVLKELHWSATNHSLHVLLDEIDGTMLEYEDKIAEVAMGRLNTRFGIGDLKTMLPDAKTLDSLLKEMEKDLSEVKKSVGEEEKYCGLQNIFDDIMSDINKWNYLKTLS